MRGFLRGAAEPPLGFRIFWILNSQQPLENCRKFHFSGKLKIEIHAKKNKGGREKWSSPSIQKYSVLFWREMSKKNLKKDDNFARSAKIFWKNTIHTSNFEVFFDKRDTFVERQNASKFSKKVEKIFWPNGGEFWPMGGGTFPNSSRHGTRLPRRPLVRVRDRPGVCCRGRGRGCRPPAGAGAGGAYPTPGRGRGPTPGRGRGGGS